MLSFTGVISLTTNNEGLSMKKPPNYSAASILRNAGGFFV